MENEEKQIGEVDDYFEHVNAAAIKLSDKLSVGDTIRIKGGENTDFEQQVESIQINHKDVQEAEAGQDVGILLKEKVRKGYKLFKK